MASLVLAFISIGVSLIYSSIPALYMVSRSTVSYHDMHSKEPRRSLPMDGRPCVHSLVPYSGRYVCFPALVEVECGFIIGCNCDSAMWDRGSGAAG